MAVAKCGRICVCVCVCQNGGTPKLVGFPLASLYIPAERIPPNSSFTNRQYMTICAGSGFRTHLLEPNLRSRNP